MTDFVVWAHRLNTPEVVPIAMFDNREAADKLSDLLLGGFVVKRVPTPAPVRPVSVEQVAKAMFEAPDVEDGYVNTWPPKHEDDYDYWMQAAQVAIDAIGGGK